MMREPTGAVGEIFIVTSITVGEITLGSPTILMPAPRSIIQPDLKFEPLIRIFIFFDPWLAAGGYTVDIIGPPGVRIVWIMRELNPAPIILFSNM
jgi:hypothetical protein